MTLGKERKQFWSSWPPSSPLWPFNARPFMAESQSKNRHNFDIWKLVKLQKQLWCFASENWSIKSLLGAEGVFTSRDKHRPRTGAESSWPVWNVAAELFLEIFMKFDHVRTDLVHWQDCTQEFKRTRYTSDTCTGIRYTLHVLNVI